VHFQFALSARAGTDALGHLLRAAWALDLDAIVIVIDGVGIFDHDLRRIIFNSFHKNPGLSPFVPSILLFYGGPMEYCKRIRRAIRGLPNKARCPQNSSLDCVEYLTRNSSFADDPLKSQSLGIDRFKKTYNTSAYVF